MNGLKYIMCIKGMTLKEIGEITGYTVTTVNFWTTGRRNIPEDALKQLVEYFNMPSWLITKKVDSKDRIAIDMALEMPGLNEKEKEYVQMALEGKIDMIQGTQQVVTTEAPIYPTMKTPNKIFILNYEEDAFTDFDKIAQYRVEIITAKEGSNDLRVQIKIKAKLSENWSETLLKEEATIITKDPQKVVKREVALMCQRKIEEMNFHATQLKEIALSEEVNSDEFILDPKQHLSIVKDELFEKYACKEKEEQKITCDFMGFDDFEEEEEPDDDFMDFGEYV